MVSVEYNCFNVVSTRSSDNNFFSSTFKVFFSCFFLSKETSSFKNDFYTVSSPVDLFWITFSRNFDEFTVNFKSTFFNFNSTVETTLSCVVFQQVCKHNWICKVVDACNFNTFYALDTTESKTTDTSETVNTNFNYH
ncbi:Uncharacterised protein [Streptococcus pneumoniae]|nr:Uncharacterised protein [Streptococcus pneumoniae]